MNQHSSNKQKYYRPVIGAALAVVSLFQFSLPVLAVGTDAGLELKNRATATYDDGTTPYEVISNEVTVTVGKIAGITNVPSTYTNNSSNATVLPGDSVSFDFVVTNTGNDVSKIFIPSATSINGNSVNITIDGSDATSIQYSIDGTNFIDRPADGIIDNIVENTSITVRVTGTINPLANVGDEIKVQLGDTGNNTADTNDPDFPNTQNQPDAGGASDPQEQDVRTLTGDNTNTDVDGDPVNGQREASATHIISVGSNPLALTRIRKTNAGVVTSGTPEDLSDDVITYNLELDVLAQKLARYNNFAFNPAALEGRDYSGGGSPTISGTGITDTTNLVLISDAIPENTLLDPATVATNVTAPTGWTAVYTDDLLTTAADDATWVTDPTTLGTITRIGWVYDANASSAIATGQTETGFSFKVVTNGLSNTATSIYNMAQVFGSTDDGAAGTTGTTTFDESGDENPNNFEDDGTTGPDETVPEGNGEFGFADPGTNEDNVDTAGDNTQTGSTGGEVNKVVVSLAPVTPDLLNGPNNLPQAEGGLFGTDPADNNHDFQNLAAPIPVATDQTVDVNNGNPDTTLTAASTITFTNTVQNTETGDISSVILEPISPEDLGLGGTALDLQNGTIVTISYAAQTVTYTYNSSSTGSFAITASNTGGIPVTIPTVSGTNAGAGQNTENYTVTVTLPTGTPLSTNDTVGGYPVPIVAYVDNGTTANAPDTDDTYNVTIDQVYLGYLKLVKKARVLEDTDGDGLYTLVTGMDFDDPDTNKSPAPGRIIEYQVNYSNISEAQGNGSNNVILNAENVTISEDGTGTTVTSNNWAQDSTEDNDTIIDTLHVPNQAVDSNGGAITYFSGASGSTASTNADKEVTKYINTISTVAPGDDGTFTFQRKVTDESDIEELSP